MFLSWHRLLRQKVRLDSIEQCFKANLDNMLGFGMRASRPAMALATPSTQPTTFWTRLLRGLLHSLVLTMVSLDTFSSSQKIRTKLLLSGLSIELFLDQANYMLASMTQTCLPWQTSMDLNCSQIQRAQSPFKW